MQWVEDTEALDEVASVDVGLLTGLPISEEHPAEVEARDEEKPQDPIFLDDDGIEVVGVGQREGVTHLTLPRTSPYELRISNSHTPHLLLTVGIGDSEAIGLLGEGAMDTIVPSEGTPHK